MTCSAVFWLCSACVNDKSPCGELPNCASSMHSPNLQSTWQFCRRTSHANFRLLPSVIRYALFSTNSMRKRIGNSPVTNTGPGTQDSGYPKFLDWFRYFGAFMLFIYGVSKLLHLQFNLQSELAHRPVGSLNGYELTWYYYGYSRGYACLLGATQVVGASLLLFRRTSLVAALLMMPVVANILLINIFILVDDYGPYVISALILMSLLCVLWNQRHRLVSTFWSSQLPEPSKSRRMHRWIRSAIIALVLAIFISGSVLQHYFPKR